MRYQLDPLSPTGISKEAEKQTYRPYFAGGPGKPSLLDSVNGKHGAVQITAGTNVTIDNSGKDTIRISSSGSGGSGTVESIVAGTDIDVDATDPANPIISVGLDDEVYGAGWNGDTTAPTKNAVYDKIETISSGGISESLAIAYAVAL